MQPGIAGQVAVKPPSSESGVRTTLNFMGNLHSWSIVLDSPARRHRKVRFDLPDQAQVVHTIATDDPAGIEAHWQGRFDSKRIRDAEFFSLDAHDVAAFKRRKRIAWDRPTKFCKGSWR
jgi:hypothetical protein